MKRGYDFAVSRTTIEKILRAMQVKPLLRLRRLQKGSARYARNIPGERVQMDTCKIAPSVYQYTAIDDCTRIRVLATYASRGFFAKTCLCTSRLKIRIPRPICY